MPLLAILPPRLRRILIQRLIFRFNLKFDYPARKHLVMENMRKVFPEDPELGWKAELNLAYDILQDSATYKFRFPRLCGWRQSIRLEGKAHLEQALENGKGALLLTGHSGAFVSSVWGHGFHGIQASLLTNDSPSSDDFSRAYRLFARLVISTIEKSCLRPVVTFPLGGDKSKAITASRKIKSLLQANEPVIAALDVPPNLTSSREQVDFLGRTCLMPSGIIRIAKKTGSPVVVYSAPWDRPFSHDCTIKFAGTLSLDAPLKEDIRKCSAAIEQIIRTNPEQWAHWDAFQHFLIDAPGTIETTGTNAPPAGSGAPEESKIT